MTKTNYTCNHRKERIRVYLTTPENSGIKGFAKLTDYYQYRAPMIDSIHSADCKLSKKDQDELIAKMLSDACLKTRKVPYIRGGIDNNHSVNGCSGYSLPHHV